MSDDEGLDEARERFRQAFLEAGAEIVRQASEDLSRGGMGTTATVLVLRPDEQYIVGHIGDSRAYVLRDGELLRITTDHSWVEEQVERGMISREDAFRHPQSNIITRALGSDATPSPDLYPGSIEPDDRYLLCTDGLTDMIGEERIARILSQVDGPRPTAARLVSEANMLGGADNVTALVVDVTEAPEP